VVPGHADVPEWSLLGTVPPDGEPGLAVLGDVVQVDDACLQADRRFAAAVDEVKLVGLTPDVPAVADSVTSGRSAMRSCLDACFLTAISFAG